MSPFMQTLLILLSFLVLLGYLHWCWSEHARLSDGMQVLSMLALLGLFWGSVVLWVDWMRRWTQALDMHPAACREPVCPGGGLSAHDQWLAMVMFVVSAGVALLVVVAHPNEGATVTTEGDDH